MKIQHCHRQWSCFDTDTVAGWMFSSEIEQRFLSNVEALRFNVPDFKNDGRVTSCAMHVARREKYLGDSVGRCAPEG